MKNNNKITTRIIAGKYKGKSLDLPSLAVTRSSKSMLKESYFNTLQFDIVDATFVEFFGGSGSVGLEALSRGAKEIYFFEKDPNSFKILQANIDSCDASACTAIRGDVFTLAPERIKRLAKEDKEVYFYADPPFEIRDGMNDIYTKTFDLLESIPSSIVALLTIEHMSELEMPQTVGELTLRKQKKFGKTTLSYYQV